jgi:peptidoglycan hydrolase CwlO-like protein
VLIMKRQHLLAFGAVALMAFGSLGITNLRTTQHKVELQQIQLEDRGAELKKLQLHYETLNKNLDTELQNKNQSAERIKQLEDEKARLEQEKAKLEQDLQAKAAAKQAQQVAIQNAVPKAQVAYAGNASGAKLFIYMHESGNNPNSINRSSGACGLGQGSTLL